MALTPIGTNYTAISNYNLTLGLPSTTSEWIPAIITNASSTPYFAMIIMCAWSLLLFWTLSEKSPFAEFKFSDPRGLNATLGIVSVLGITWLEVGFFTHFRTVALFVVLFVISYIYSSIHENKE